jgi:hypothetical protein
MAEGLERARIADLRADLSDGARAAFLDARLSVAERQIVVTALSHDPGERAEISSAAALLDCVGTDLIPLPPSLLAKGAATFAAANSAARPGVAVGGQRTWLQQGPLIVGAGLAAFIVVMTAASALLSPAGKGILAPSAEPIGAVRPTAGTGRAIARAIVLTPDATEGPKSISARGESGAPSCDDDHEVAGRRHGPCGIGKATDGATTDGATDVAAWDASYRPQAPPADNHSIKPHFDGPSLRTASLRHSRALRPGTAVDDLSVVPQDLFEIAGRAVSLFGQLGKDLVDPRCRVLHHQTSRGRNSGKSLSRWCTTHLPIIAIHGG